MFSTTHPTLFINDKTLKTPPINDEPRIEFNLHHEIFEFKNQPELIDSDYYLNKNGKYYVILNYIKNQANDLNMIIPPHEIEDKSTVNHINRFFDDLVPRVNYETFEFHNKPELIHPKYYCELNGKYHVNLNYITMERKPLIKNEDLEDHISQSPKENDKEIPLSLHTSIFIDNENRIHIEDKTYTNENQLHAARALTEMLIIKFFEKYQIQLTPLVGTKENFIVKNNTKIHHHTFMFYKKPELISSDHYYLDNNKYHANLNYVKNESTQLNTNADNLIIIQNQGMLKGYKIIFSSTHTIHLMQLLHEIKKDKKLGYDDLKLPTLKVISGSNLIHTTQKITM